MAMRVLITGSHGQLGNELRRQIGAGRSEIGLIPRCYENAHVDSIDLEDLDISDAHAVGQWFSEHSPYDLVINCAAMTNVDGCESDFATAFAANALGPMNLARACAAQGTKLMHVSTDYVFPGTDPSPRVETDSPAPISAYGRSKLAGEGLALSANPKTFVVRTAWLYGYVGRNFVKTMLALGASHDKISVVDDQLGNPTSASDLAHEMLIIATTDSYGVYHCTNEGTCSWADFAQAIMRGAGLDCVIERCTSADWKALHPETADRPLFSSLENARLADTVGNDMRCWQDALSAYLTNLALMEG